MKISALSKTIWASAFAVSVAILPLALSACTQGGTGTTGGTTGGTSTPGGTGTTGGTTGGTSSP